MQTDRTDLRDRVAREIEAALIAEGGCVSETYVHEGGLHRDFDGTVSLTQIADRILALPGIAEALMIHRAWQVDQMPDLSPERVGEIMRYLSDTPTA